MRIIICDDDPVFLNEMSGRIRTYFEKQDRDVTVKTVLDGKELLRMLRNHPADAVFLDIDMPGINGFETAGAVKKQYPDCILVFSSCHNELVYDSFEYEPFWFLCKSNAEEKTGMVLDKIVLKLNAGRREYAVRTKDRIIRVRYSDLLYAEVEKHKVRLHLQDDAVEFRGRLSDTAGELEQHGFVRINSGCVVNLEWISRIQNSDLFLKNGEILAVSRGCKKQVKEIFYNYLERT